MRLLHAGIDVAVIALWLGHERIATTHIYLHAHEPEGASDSPSHPAQHHTRPLPAARPATRLPRQPLIVPT
jgi:hypothetical protein